MSELVQYVMDHTERGECQCGSCCDKGGRPDPEGHTVNMGFFKVSAKDANKDVFVKLTKEHRGVFGDVDPLDGKEHGYMELGGWIGDGIAMQYMGLGVLLGVFKLLDPSLLRIPREDPMFMQLLQSGLLTVVAQQAA